MVSWRYQQDEPYKAISEGRFAEVDFDKYPIVTHESTPPPHGLIPGKLRSGQRCLLVTMRIYTTYRFCVCVLVGLMLNTILAVNRAGYFGVVKETSFSLCSGRLKRLIPCSSIFFTAFLTRDGVGLISNIQNVLWGLFCMIAQKRRFKSLRLDT